jgi:hypothetical protein
MKEPKLQPKEVRDARNVDCLLRKATGREQSQPKREAMWPTADKALGVGLIKPFGNHIMLLCVPDAGHGGIRFNVCSGGFWSCFGPILWNVCVCFVPLYLGYM